MNYYLIYFLFSCFGAIIIYKSRVSIIAKGTLAFVLIYTLIGFLPIETSYRGVNNIDVFLIYILCFCALFIGMNFSLSRQRASLINFKTPLLFKQLYFIHLFLVYTILIYLFFSSGNILINQELRLGTNPFLAYIARSLTFVPLIVVCANKVKKIRFSFLLYYIILPVLPSILLGARGTAVTMIFGVLLLLVYNNRKNTFTNSFSIVFKKKKKKILVYGGCVSLFVIYYLFFLRHNGENLSSIDSLILEYFNNPSFLFLIILPLYLGFKETIGITTKIITTEEVNTYLDYPLVFAELFTILPGEQTAPGRIISGEIFGLGPFVDKGYTPGLIGGLYLDFGYSGTIFIFFLIGLFFCLFYKKVKTTKQLVVYVYLIISFIHLFHRGFLKPEYLTNLLIIAIYLSANKSVRTSPSIH